MRTLCRFVPVLLVLALAACASSGPMASSTAPSARPDVQPNLMHDDGEYIARVNAEARRRGLLVHWVNPPPKHVAARVE
ncbi:hypothetical protein E5843_05220 [Luteimonas yindakuii]|uniref:hypothetical protein n=1 Tax=Luteimonas yindakuii TaxID=2565782 RepID=UPI0010A30AD7|nr:hypothetical protein [Luteimonas yindakuii]QCO67332.1 hypothetical protein E5843_05220 [Luteimonas yindakuii]